MSTPSDIGLPQPATLTTANESPTANDEFSRSEIADFETCMKTLITRLKSKHASYESYLEPTAYNFRITQVIKCIKGNKVYWRRGKELEDAIRDAEKVASFWTNISCSRKEKREQTTKVIESLSEIRARVLGGLQR